MTPTLRSAHIQKRVQRQSIKKELFFKDSYLLKYDPPPQRVHNLNTWVDRMIQAQAKVASL